MRVLPSLCLLSESAEAAASMAATPESSDDDEANEVVEVEEVSKGETRKEGGDEDEEARPAVGMLVTPCLSAIRPIKLSFFTAFFSKAPKALPPPPPPPPPPSPLLLLPSQLSWDPPLLLLWSSPTF